MTQLPVGRFYLLGTGEERGGPLSVLDGYALLNRMIGENWYPGSTAEVVTYPASIGVVSGSLAAPRVEEGVETGRRSLDEQIKSVAATGEPVRIAGLSEGTLVINRELARLATDPTAPRADLLSFVLFSSPELGLASIYLPVGARVPIIDYTMTPLADSQYDVSVVFHQYDAWADPPDRPWNLLAVANTLFGLAYYHNKAALAAPSDAVEVSRVTSELGGTTTTYMVPAPTVPLLKPLQQLGVPKGIVDGMNSVLKPMVDAGYSRLNPDAGPFFSHGRLRPSSAAATPDPALDSLAIDEDAEEAIQEDGEDVDVKGDVALARTFAADAADDQEAQRVDQQSASTTDSPDPDSEDSTAEDAA
ncbi:PE-PPE domain-containing protein [Mycolicibacterium sp. XJ1819]